MTQRQGGHKRIAGAQPAAVRFAGRGLLVLTLINLLNYLDRFVPSALLPQMKASGIVSTDFQLGILAPGFLLVYMLAAPAFGYLGDRRSRTRPIAIGVALWSLATMWSGLARNYGELFASRAAVGIGEAAYATIAPALLADYYPPARRGRIFAIFYMAIPVGAALGYVVGGWYRRPGAGAQHSSSQDCPVWSWHWRCCGSRTRRAAPWNPRRRLHRSCCTPLPPSDPESERRCVER